MRVLCLVPLNGLGGAGDELTGQRNRYRIIDQARLLNCLECQSAERFRAWYDNTVGDDVCGTLHREREPYWTEPSAVGSLQWVERFGNGLPRNSCAIEPVAMGVAEKPEAYLLRTSNRYREGLTGTLQQRRKYP